MTSKTLKLSLSFSWSRFFCMPKKVRQKFKYLENEKSFFIIFEGLSLKQIKNFFSEGESPTLNKSCMYCNKKLSKFFHCSACKSGSYCLNLCQKNIYKEHKLLCNSIQEPEQIEMEKRYKKFNCSYETTIDNK